MLGTGGVPASNRRAAAAGERELAAGNLCRHGDEVLRAIELEVVQFEGNGDVRDGIVEHQRVFELPLLVRRRELREGLAAEITRAVVQLRREVLQRDHDLAELAVQVRIGGVVAEDVVARDRLLGVLHPDGQVVDVEQRLAARVRREGVHRVLRALEVVGEPHRARALHQVVRER